MKTSLLVLLCCFLISCSGPVFIAKTELEGIRTSYQDPKLNELSTKNQEVLRDIYRRYQLAGIDVYPNGIGFSALSDSAGKTFYYLLVDVRPRDITFGFGEGLNHHMEKNLRYLREQDIQRAGVDGLAFAIHWPVRDFSQCDKYGGFLEYIMVYLSKTDFLSYAGGEDTFAEAIRKAEVLASLNRKKAEAIRVIREE
jgi:hypothetical protein